METIHILNGPNLNLLGMRETNIYGHKTISDLENMCRRRASENGFQVVFKQTNSESTLVDFIQEAIGKSSAIIINAAAYTHTSIAILDALKSFAGYVVEVHISDISKREEFRKFSFVSLRADLVIQGLGLDGYIEAIDKVVAQKANK